MLDSSFAAAIRKKLVVVGDGGCGKTSLLVVYRRGAFPERYVPTVFENYIANVQIDNKLVQLALWDTAGQEDYDRLRPLSYPETHVILICFAIDQPTSFANVQDRWVPEVTHFCEGVPKILVGTKIDLRDNATRIAQLSGLGHHLTTYEEGERLGREINARYYECSAMLNQNVNEVIEAAIRSAMAGGIMKLQKKLCTIL
ncbi:small GTPase-binding protein [Dichotomocladium elegans]|nr:small GTPase-binding protein [Dichotomocladium elegans]